MGGKQGFQEPWVVLYSFYVQLLLINLVSSVNWEVRSKVKLSALIGLKIGPIRVK